MNLEQKKVFAERLWKLRTEQNLSQQQLSEETNINRETIAKYETVKRIPSYEHLTKFAEYFHVSTDYLLGLQREPTNSPDVIAITEYTALSKEAIEKLHQIGIKNYSTANSDTLSVLIEDVNFVYFLSLLSAKMCADSNSAKTVETSIGKVGITVPVNALNSYEIEKIISEISFRMKSEFLKRYKTVEEITDVLFEVMLLKNKKQITEQEYEKLIAEFNKGNYDYVEQCLKSMIGRNINNGNNNQTNK